MKLHVANFRVRHITDSGAAFAVDMNTGEQVFCNPGVCEGHNLQFGDLIRAACERNAKSDTEWYALIVEPIWEDEGA
jgi:hypothetical protein